ncbi:MAG: polyphosphate kinase 2 [Planctomycetota bacterium]|jgi:polyphosphate kinase 2
MASKSKKKSSPETSPAKGGTEPPQTFSEDGPYPYDTGMKRKAYEKTLRLLQIELLKAQRWGKEQGERVVIVFEGRDAAGKGGTIKRFTEHLNPRGARVVALLKPNDTERGQWFFQRYIAHLPTRGEIVFFDRSWYNRAGVEPVMGFCTPAEYREFLVHVTPLERGLVDTGIRLFKLWFAVSRQEQRRRFKDRETDPLKHWKLSPTDLASMDRWDAYTAARDRMFFMSHSRDAPWAIIRSDDKRRARINALRHVLAHLPYPEKDESVVGETDPLIVGTPHAAEPTHAEFEAMSSRSSVSS